MIGSFLLVAILCASGILAACGGGSSQPAQDQPSASGSLDANVLSQDDSNGSDTVESLSAVATDGELAFLTEDGVTLSGRVYGAGLVGIVLVHEPGTSAQRWEAMAPALAENGYRVLAFDLRGHGRSEGEAGDGQREDVLAAVSYLRDESLSEIVVVGIDSSAVAALDAAGNSATIAGVVSLTIDDGAIGSLTETALENFESLRIPTLFLAGSEASEGSTRQVLTDRLDNDESIRFSGEPADGDLLASPAGPEIFALTSTFMSRFD